ncbi:MAG: FmdB family zinc ribbon protein [Candidatus Omnitrophota bacterium]
MAVYTYTCKKCAFRFTRDRSLVDEPDHICPKCLSPSDILSGPAWRYGEKVLDPYGYDQGSRRYDEDGYTGPWLGDRKKEASH